MRTSFKNTMNEQEISKRIKLLTKQKHFKKDYTPMTEEEISSETGVELKTIQAILKKSLKSLAQKGISEEHLKKML